MTYKKLTSVSRRFSPSMSSSPGFNSPPGLQKVKCKLMVATYSQIELQCHTAWKRLFPTAIARHGAGHVRARVGCLRHFASFQLFRIPPSSAGIWLELMDPVQTGDPLCRKCNLIRDTCFTNCKHLTRVCSSVTTTAPKERHVGNFQTRGPTYKFIVLCSVKDDWLNLGDVEFSFLTLGHPALIL